MSYDHIGKGSTLSSLIDALKASAFLGHIWLYKFAINITFYYIVYSSDSI